MITKVLLADDHQMVREGLKNLLLKQTDILVVGEAQDGRSTIDMVDKLLPDLIIMDIGMPGLNGIEATRKIIAQHPHIKVIALSMHSDRRYVQEMFKSGVSGYLLKDSAFEELVKAIQVIMDNKVYLSPQISDMVIQNFIHNPGEDKSTAFSSLTPKEREVLQLLAEGKSTKEIASDLKISVKTVETHRAQIMDKLDIHSVAELTKYAIREGLTSLDS